MEYEEIKEMMNSKGIVAQTIFEDCMSCIEDVDEFKSYGRDTIATFGVNYTGLLLNLIKEKPDVYKKMFELSDDEFEDVLLDCETMPHLYYPIELDKIQRMDEVVNSDYMYNAF
jgi:hypothetical protein